MNSSSKIWFGLRVKVLAFALAFSTLGLGFIGYIFMDMEKQMMQEFKEEQVDFIESFVSKTLKPVMLTGSATIMPSLLASYQEFSGMDSIQILRVNGEQAFTDSATIDKVNKRVGFKKFSRSELSKSVQVLPPDDPLLNKALSTKKRTVQDILLPDGSSHVRMIIPFVNEERCHVCHGGNHQIRGVMVASFPVTELVKKGSSRLEVFMKFSVLAILLMVVGMYSLFDSFIVKRISNIAANVKGLINKEKLDTRLDAGGKDEISELANEFNEFINAVDEYRQRQATEKDRLELAVQEQTRELRQKNAIIEEDMRVAARVQSGLLPGKLPPINDMEFQAEYIPCLSIGGDFYDVLRIDDDHIGLFMADATGHGAAAALIVSMVKTLLIGEEKNLHDPAKIVKYLNDFLVTHTPEDTFITLFYGVLNVESGHLLYTLAGHPSPVILPANGGETRFMESTGGFVGAFEDDEFEEAETYLHRGDRLFIYTDGLTEAQDLEGKQLGEQAMVEALMDGNELASGKILGAMCNKIIFYTAGATLSDDVTMLVVDYGRGRA